MGETQKAYEAMPGQGAGFVALREVDYYEDRDWRKDGNCLDVDPNVFFPPKGGDNGEKAKTICRQCVVREECLEDAIANNERFGIWGGMNTGERKLIRKARTMARQALNS